MAPGLTRGEYADAGLEQNDIASQEWIRSVTPLGRIGEPDEIAGAAVFLAAAAGTFMTGQTIVIDGGATIS